MNIYKILIYSHIILLIMISFVAIIDADTALYIFNHKIITKIIKNIDIVSMFLIGVFMINNLFLNHYERWLHYLYETNKSAISKYKKTPDPTIIDIYFMPYDHNRVKEIKKKIISYTKII